VLCAAQFVDVLGVTIVVVALPSIGAEFGLAGSGLQWVVSIYALCFGGFLILSGRAADHYGRRRLFRVGLALFAAASLACALAPSAVALVGARALQGLGAALVVPAALSLVTTTFSDPAERTRALAIWTAAAAAGGATGFVVGGPITQGLGWEWVFLFNLPFCVVSFGLAPHVLSESRDRAAGQPLDLWGAFTVTGGLVALIFAATHTAEAGFLAPTTLGAVVLATWLLYAFLRLEHRVPCPLVPPRLLRSSAPVAANLTAFSLTAVTSSAGVLHTLYLQQVLDLSPVTTGLVFVPLSTAVIAGSTVSPALTRRRGARATMTGGLLLVSLAMVVVCRVTAESGLALVMAAMILSGLGLGVAAVASTSTGTASASADQQGLASGLLNTATQAGTALGVAALVSLAAAVTGDGGSSAALVDGLRAAYLAAAVLALTAALAVFQMVGDRTPRGVT
jgi:MFS family permease